MMNIINDNIKTLSEKQLCKKIVKQQSEWQAAFSVLIERYHAYLYHRCLQHLRNKNDIDDVLQNVYISIYRYLSDFQGRSSLKTWITRIVDNQCIAMIKNNQRITKKNALMIDHIQVFIALKTTRNSERFDNETDQKNRVMCIMDNLPYKSREIISLRYWSDLTFEEIAVTLDISLSAAKMRLYRALEQCTIIIGTDDFLAA